jgi:hypothetical protein
MDEPLFEDGKPARITPADFRRYHLPTFPKLADERNEEIIRQAIEYVYTMFSGVETIWKKQPKPVWHDKTRTCYRLLTAWLIADLYPKFVSGMPVMGGLPLKRKKIGGVDLTFQDAGKLAGSGYLDLLAGLDSNPFGKLAKIMITASAARFSTFNTLWT